MYVGKATSIRKRVGGHFSGKSTSGGAEMIDRIATIDFLVTETEAEALLAEQQFIKRHRPRFNIRLRDDKSYPYIGISLDEEFPRVYFTRERHRSQRHLLRPLLVGQAGARDARPARAPVPVPHLRRARARTALRRSLPRLLHQALRGTLRRLRRPRGVPARHRRDRRLPLGPLPRRRARPRAQDGRGRGVRGVRARRRVPRPARGGALADGAALGRRRDASTGPTWSRSRSRARRPTRRCSRSATACSPSATASTSRTRRSATRPR